MPRLSRRCESSACCREFLAPYGVGLGGVPPDRSALPTYILYICRRSIGYMRYTVLTYQPIEPILAYTSSMSMLDILPFHGLALLSYRITYISNSTMADDESHGMKLRPSQKKLPCIPPRTRVTGIFGLLTPALNDMFATTPPEFEIFSRSMVKS